MLSVLIVEDDAKFRDHLVQRLSLREFRVLGAALDDAAAELAGRERVRAVVLDISGPRARVLSFLEKVRKASPESRVILINRTADVSLSIEAMKLGASDEVTAPVDIEMLERKIRAPGSRTDAAPRNK